MNYIPLEEILKSVVWSSSSLFASHFFRDFREQTENLRAMGPIIAAQKMVGAVPIWSPTRTKRYPEVHSYTRDTACLKVINSYTINTGL